MQKCLYKIGYGYDSHRFLNEQEKKKLLEDNKTFENETEYFSPDKPLIIGGVVLEDKYQKQYGAFKARSDGDVLYHAVVNALLSALGIQEKRDIGTIFPNTDSKNSNRQSSDFIEAAVALIEASSYELVDLKIMVKGKPRVDLAAIEKNLREFFLFQETTPSIHLQGTSGEEMDAAGNGLGVEIFAICLLQQKALAQKLMELLR